MRKLIAALTVASAFAVAPAAHAADEAFLRIDGLQGDAVIGNSKSYIAIKNFSWGAEHKATIGSASGGAGAEKAAFQELSIDKAVDASSPALFQRMATGAPIQSMELVVRKAGATSPIHLRYHFQMAFITATETSGGTGAEGTTETIKFAFGAASQSFQRQTPTGALSGESLFGGWNAIRNMGVPAYPAFGTPAAL